MIWPFKRKRVEPADETLTGVTATLTASHRSREHGDVHEHTWHITVWLAPNKPTDACQRRSDLLQWVAHYEGKCLPDEIAWAEDMAQAIRRYMEPDCNGYSGWLGTVHSVEISREVEGLLARKIFRGAA